MCTTFLVKNHIKGWALNLVLIQRLDSEAWTITTFLRFWIESIVYVKKHTREREPPTNASSSETQGQIVGARESLNRRKTGRKLAFFWHQSEARTAATVWNWSGKTLSPGALLAVLYFSSCLIFRPFRLSLAPTICPWVSEDANASHMRRI